MENCVMAIGAHPDDVEIGMGGTVAALMAAGRKVVIVDITDGEPTPRGSKEKRAAESAEAAKILGVAERITLDMPNREVFDTVENRSKLANIIRRFKPKVLFIPYWEDAHPDHVQVCALCEAARFYAKLEKSKLEHSAHYPERVYHYFAMHLRAKVSPSFVFDTSKTEELKMSAVIAYRSQFVDFERNKAVPDLIRAHDAYWGRQIYREYGEPFICRETIRLDAVEGLLNA